MNLIQSAITKGGSFYLNCFSKFMSTSHKALVQRQEKNWKALRKSLQGTAIYQDMKLEYIESYEDYVQHVPAYDFDFYAPYAERIAQGESDVLFKGRPKYCGLTSGTTGQNSKRIFYNKAMMKTFVKAQRRVAARINHLEPDLQILDVSRLAFGSAPTVYTKEDVTYGYISGLLSTKTPPALKRKTFPSAEALALSDWDKKIEQIMQESLHQDIQVVSGIPTYLISIFEAILAKTKKERINQIWPNLKVMVYAATPVKQYAERLNSLVGHELSYYGLYAATEAPIGLAHQAFTDGSQKYILNPDLLYSFTQAEGPKRTLGLHQIEIGQPYFVNIGTPNGLVHYAMKDQIVFHLSGDDLVFEFVGRKNTGLNLAAEKVSEDDLLNTIIRTKELINQDIRHYFVAPTTQKCGRPTYQWTLFVDVTQFPPPDQMAKILDFNLQSTNLDYADVREDEIVGEPIVQYICASRLYSYFEKNRDRGQFKMKTSFQTPEEFHTFMNNNFSQH